MWTGLVRLGFRLGPSAALSTGLLHYHGALMVSGFLGTLIGVERAVACGRRWAWWGPALSGFGALALAAGFPAAGLSGMAAAAVVMTTVMVSLWRRQPSLATGLMALAPLAWLVGNLVLLANGATSRALPWWAGFLILTIAGERLVLSRLVRISRTALALFVVGSAATLGGPVLDSWSSGLGTRVAAAGWIVLAAWLLRFDVARHRARAGGLPRFVAAALMAGCCWLAVAGLLTVSEGLDPMARTVAFATLPTATALPYDAATHALLLGFVFSMIFAHAPIILPAVLGRAVEWRGRFWVHLGLLHVSVGARIAADLAGLLTVRSWAGVGNALAIALFALSTALAVARPASSAGRSTAASSLEAGGGVAPGASPRTRR